MYKDKKRLENGRYRYLSDCPDCMKERWVSDLRSVGIRCRKCAGEKKKIKYSRVWPCKCKRCDKSMMLKTKPKIIGSATCDVCKGLYGGAIAKKKPEKKKPAKRKAKCSECNISFEPRTKLIVTCSSRCSKIRQKRYEVERRSKKLLNIRKKTKKKKVKEKISKPKTDKASIGGVDKEEKPIYIRAHQKVRIELRDKKALSDNELSSFLIKKYLKNGGTLSSKAEDSDFLNRKGMTDCIRGGSYGY